MATYEDGTRDCAACNRRLPLEDFWFENKRTGKRHYRCKECHGHYIRSWIGANGEKRRAAVQRYGKRHGLRYRRYGITEADYDELLKSQGGACAICGESDNGRTLHIDHDHQDGRIRGLLCGQCNTGIGKLRHNDVFLLRAVRYLRASRRAAAI